MSIPILGTTTIFMLKRKPKSTACILAVAVVVLCSTRAASRNADAQTKPKIAVSAEFQCLWWNTHQMDGMDPNNPPPKQTRVTLTSWEYSDPIGVPHPDTVELAIKIRNNSSVALDGTVIQVEAQWLEGLQSRKNSAMWGERERVGKPLTRSIAPNGREIVILPIDISAKMKTLAASKRWPWSLRVFIVVRNSGKLIASDRLELPITPGD